MSACTVMLASSVGVFIGVACVWVADKLKERAKARQDAIVWSFYRAQNAVVKATLDKERSEFASGFTEER